MNVVEIGDRQVGAGRPCFVIAEAGVNHNGQAELAHGLVEAAVEAGADAVKFQIFRTESLVTARAPKAAYQVPGGPESESQFEMLKNLELPCEVFCQLEQHCRELGVVFLATPFDRESADFLERLAVAAFKVGSGDLTNHPFLEHLANKGRPIILSTGMSTLAEVDEAVRLIRERADVPLILLHCVSSYPALPADVNLRAMRTMALAFQSLVGFSDHTEGIETALAAVALEACVVEKHLTLNRKLSGPDHRCSLEPEGFAELVRGVRTVESALGSGIKAPTAAEADVLAAARRSLVLRVSVSAGQMIDADCLTALRPAGGIPPSLARLVIGRCAARDLGAGQALDWRDLQ